MSQAEARSQCHSKDRHVIIMLCYNLMNRSFELDEEHRVSSTGMIAVPMQVKTSDLMPCELMNTILVICTQRTF